MSARTLLALGAAAGGLAVLLGAFGAHALKARLSAEQLLAFETGVRYQMYHALALFACAWLLERGTPGAGIAGGLFAAGLLLFSGSLYLLATRELTGLSSGRWLGPVTPLGGLCFIAGWVTVLAGALRGR
jgi:uncharacterized membrane protein YgdD (TMEM256/DUF423 family)